MPTSNRQSLFRRFALLTIVSVYILILVGGIVRATGSGMGCPDWPKCFGSWVPPTSEAQLPADYRQAYINKRIAKNARIATLLDKLGFKEEAQRIVNDPAVLRESPFNATQTWIEYLNRLTGVLIGIFIFLALVFSFAYRKADSSIIWLCFWAFVAVLAEGFLGSIVVSTNLIPAIISIHMVLALVIVGLLIFAIARAQKGLQFPPADKLPRMQYLLWFLLLLSLVQITAGTQVREQTDVLLYQTARTSVVEGYDWQFYFHRSFSLVVLLGNIYLYLLVKRYAKASKMLNFATLFLLAVIAVEVVIGVVLAYGGLPAWAQPVHLLLGSIMAGLQLFALCILPYHKKDNIQAQPAFTY